MVNTSQQVGGDGRDREKAGLIRGRSQLKQLVYQALV
jgi:hypothetical protein